MRFGTWSCVGAQVQRRSRPGSFGRSFRSRPGSWHPRWRAVMSGDRTGRLLYGTERSRRSTPSRRRSAPLQLGTCLRYVGALRARDSSADEHWTAACAQLTARRDLFRVSRAAVILTGIVRVPAARRAEIQLKTLTVTRRNGAFHIRRAITDGLLADAALAPSSRCGHRPSHFATHEALAARWVF